MQEFHSKQTINVGVFWMEALKICSYSLGEKFAYKNWSLFIAFNTLHCQFDIRNRFLYIYHLSSLLLCALENLKIVSDYFQERRPTWRAEEMKINACAIKHIIKIGIFPRRWMATLKNCLTCKWKHKATCILLWGEIVAIERLRKREAVMWEKY